MIARVSIEMLIARCMGRIELKCAVCLRWQGAIGIIRSTIPRTERGSSLTMTSCLPTRLPHLNTRFSVWSEHLTTSPRRTGT